MSPPKQTPSAPYSCLQTGVVVALEGPLAKVRAMRSQGCAACTCSGGDNAQNGREHILFAYNPNGAAVGQTVRLEMRADRTAAASLILYGAPLLGLFLGAWLGSRLGFFSHQDLDALTGALPGLAMGFLAAKAGLFFTGLSGKTLRKATIVHIEPDNPPLRPVAGK